MARLLDASCRLCRREGIKLMLKSSRCDTAKCAMERDSRNKPPGMHTWPRRKASSYAIRLREKQKVKRYYGVSERQFRRVFASAERARENTGLVMLELLERRLDNVVFKSGLVPSRKTARQAIVHGHIHMGGRRIDRPGYLVRQGDKIAVSPREKSQKYVREQIGLDGPRPPVGGWLDVDFNQLEAVVKALPARDDVMIPVEEHLIVEFCSR